jgi:hypothetical protein
VTEQPPDRKPLWRRLFPWVWSALGGIVLFTVSMEVVDPNRRRSMELESSTGLGAVASLVTPARASAAVRRAAILKSEAALRAGRMIIRPRARHKSC